MIADEPTTALDETVQGQIVDLLRRLQREEAFSTILITHNIALVHRLCERVIVMYGGQVVEDGPTREVVERPRHPYTAGLIASITSLEKRERPAFTLHGTVPSPGEFPGGCRFAGRCANAQDDCSTLPPPLERISATRRLACYHPVDPGGS